MADSMKSLKGITPEMATKFEGEGIRNTDQFLEAVSSAGGRRDLAKKLGVEPAALTEFINRADLARINGIAGVYADMLENAGVDSVKELAHRIPANLHTKLEQVHTEKKLSGRVPPVATIEKWVAEAKSLQETAPIEK